MKILYLHQHFSTPDGSTGTRSYEMAKRLVASGHEVTMVCGSYKGSVTGVREPFCRGKRRGLVEGIDVLEFELDYSNSMGFLKRTLVFLTFALKSIKVAMTESYDLVFATTTPLTAGMPGIFARWFRGKKFVFEVRDLWPELPKAMGVITNPLVLFLMSVLEWMSYHSAHTLIGLSPGIVDGIANRGIDRSKIALIPNGCDLELFGNTEDKWLPEGLNQNDFIALFSGAHGIANGLDAVLDAARVIKEKGQDRIKFLLIGNGKLKPHLMKRAKDEDLTNVVFHDPVGKIKLSVLMNSVDVGMQILANVPAFYYGTSPNKFFDYLSAGLPVLNNYPGWLASLIVDNVCGIAVCPEKPAEFAEALISLSNSPEVLEEMAKNAKELAKKLFDRKELARQFVDHLEEAYKS